MAHGLGSRVVAEGVETRGSSTSCAPCDNDKYQGFLYSKALPAREVERRAVLLNVEMAAPALAGTA